MILRLRFGRCWTASLLLFLFLLLLLIFKHSAHHPSYRLAHVSHAWVFAVASRWCGWLLGWLRFRLGWRSRGSGWLRLVTRRGWASSRRLGLCLRRWCRRLRLAWGRSWRLRLALRRSWRFRLARWWGCRRLWLRRGRGSRRPTSRRLRLRRRRW